MLLKMINEPHPSKTNNVANVPISESDQLVHPESDHSHHLSLVVRKPVFRFPTRSDTNQAVQSQKMARGLKFWI